MTRQLPAGLGLLSTRRLMADSLATDARILQARGLTQSQIANALGVQERTVRRWLSE